MKLFFSLSALFISITLLVMSSDSFTTAAVKNEATLSITSEESALIAIDYSNDNKLQLRNNTDKSIVVKSIKVVSNPKHEMIQTTLPISLPSGHSQEITIANDQIKSSDNAIEIKVQWDGGAADIRSTLPKVEEVEAIEDPKEEQINLELDAELEEDDEN